MRPIGFVVVAGVTLATLVGCRSMTPAFARLESAVVNDRYDGSPARTDVRVVRGDSVLPPSVSMRLQKGDSIVTSGTTRVVVTFAAGYEVALDTNTAIFIENPSIFLRIGQAFIRKLFGAGADRDTTKLDTHTPQVTLHDAGTEYLVTVDGRATDVRVLTGAVDAVTPDGRWPRVRYNALEQGRIDAITGPERMGRITRAEIETRLRWVRRVDSLTKIRVPGVDSMTEAQARATLERSGLRVMFVLQRETDTYAPGRVVDQTPSAGESVAPGSYITLTLAKAPRGELCTVPNIVEKREAEAKRLLEGARLRGEATQRIGEIDVVTSQVEKAGSRIRCGSVVRYAWGRIG